MVDRKSLIFVLYVDDLTLTADEKFKMRDMGLLQYFLGLESWEGDGDFFVGWVKYTSTIL